MSRVSGCTPRPRGISMLLGISLFLFVFTAIPWEATAQTVVVTNFSGRAKRLGKRARLGLVKALDKNGAKLVSYRQYLRKAKRNRIRGRRALRPRAIRKLSKQMNLDGVITGTATRKRRRFIVLVNVYNARGKRVLKKAYRLRKQVFPAKTASELGAIIVDKLGGQAVATAPPEPPPEPPPPEEPADTADTTTGDTGSGGGQDDAFLPPWARNEDKGTETASAATTETASSDTSEPEVETEAPRKKRKAKFGSVPDILLAAGMSGNVRAGLHPRHESGVYPGVRIDGRIFMGSFLDVPVVKDIGIGGMFNMGLALKYGLEGSGEDWDSSMMQWQAELNYRLAINDVTLAPAFLLRVGYGSTVNTIDSTNVAAVSAGYSYPYAAVDIYLMLWPPYVRMFVSGGFLFHVAGSEELTSSGMGFTVRGGLDVCLFEQMHIGAGYEMWQFFGLKESITSSEVSDTFQTFFLRVGWNFH